MAYGRRQSVLLTTEGQDRAERGQVHAVDAQERLHYTKTDYRQQDNGSLTIFVCDPASWRRAYQSWHSVRNEDKSSSLRVETVPLFIEHISKRSDGDLAANDVHLSLSMSALRPRPLPCIYRRRRR